MALKPIAIGAYVLSRYGSFRNSCKRKVREEINKRNDSIELCAEFISSNVAYVSKNDMAVTKCCGQQHQQAPDSH
jgi:hypothetical protein